MWAHPTRRYRCALSGLVALGGLIWLGAHLALGTGCGRQPSPKPAPPTKSAEPNATAAVARAEAARTFGLDALEPLARQGPTEVRVRALRGLGRIGNGRAIQVLRALLADPDAAIQQAALAALALAGDSSVAAAVAEMLEQAAQPAVRRSAAAALGRIGTGATLPALLSGLNESDAGVQAAAAIALGLYGRRQIELSPDVLAVLRDRGLRPDAPPAVRYGAVYALAHQHRPGADAALAQRLRALVADAQPEVRALAVRALARRGGADDTATAVLARALADHDWRVRVQGVRALTDAGPGGRAQLAGWMARAWPALVADAEQLSTALVHPVVEALTRLRPHVAEVPVRAAIDAVLASAAKADRDVPASHRRAVDLVHCLAAAARANTAAVRACGAPDGAGWPLHLRRELAVSTAAPTELAQFVDDTDARVRAAALVRLIEVDAMTDGDARLRAALRNDDRSIGPILAGSVAQALAARARAGRAPVLVDEVAARARVEIEREFGELELAISLLGVIEAAGDTEHLSVCERGQAHWNRSVRAAAQSCAAALRGGPGKAVAPARPPPALPVDLADVIGTAITWQVHTSKGEITIALAAEVAPWHVAALTTLAARGFYERLLWHRVVADFVVQGGDPSGSGWGGPGFAIPAEPALPGRGGGFERGAVGIADAGLDTGGCQIFIMHSRAPHLEGRYTRVGTVTAGMDVVDSLLPGDTIEHIRVHRGPR